MQQPLFRLILVLDTVRISSNGNFTVKKNLKRSLKEHLQIYYLDSYNYILVQPNVMFQAIQGQCPRCMRRYFSMEDNLRNQFIFPIIFPVFEKASVHYRHASKQHSNASYQKKKNHYFKVYIKNISLKIITVSQFN